MGLIEHIAKNILPIASVQIDEIVDEYHFLSSIPNSTQD